ncbi:DUF5133 domain-containing protein [Streptomyces sp. NPDC101393]|uniref:DUF5133 domain-containing protein n=1 Tax=Streptomyces sp. NPDC101393 TaxID=3366141 RepID=UPI0038209C10
MLLPDKAVLVSLLRRYRVWEHLALAAPHDPARRRRLEDAGYTLCVLMGHRTAREAVIAAETYLDTTARATARAPETAGESLSRQ